MQCAGLLFLLLSFSGCIESGPVTGTTELIWGRRGISEGRLQKPRALAIDQNDELYLVDMTGRIQVFTAEGEYLRGWQTPESYNGKPSGLSFDNDGDLLVADTHYFQMLVYSPQGKLLREKCIGGTNGTAPGEFGFVTDAVQDSQGNYYIAEYGENDRIQKFDSKGKFLLQWGGHGGQAMQFIRPQNLAIDEHDQIWVADACNHRISVFDASGSEANLIAQWGAEGKELGQLRYPYDLALDGRGHVYVCEFGNHRVQKFTLKGESLGAWGAGGRREGELHQPWAAALDSQGRLHVVDTYNHRVQRCRL